MARPFKDDNSSALLLLEGLNDCHVVAALCDFHQVPENFQIFDSESESKAIKKLSALLDSAEGAIPLEKIAIVLDADNDLQAKWQSISDVLSKKGYIAPNQPNINGTIITVKDKPQVGIWLMPNNQINGMLEDFCQILLDNPVALSFVEQCLNQAKTQKIATFKDVHRAKAIIHTYLAWQDEPAKPLGQAITAKILNPNHQLALTFKDWLLALFASNHVSS